MAVVRAAAVLHDIGIREAERKHGSSAGKYQEVEGPPIARRILEKLSVDPERDTTEVMAEYLPHFDRRFIGLIGSPDKILEISTHFGIHYDRREADSALGYLVDHTATITLIDRKGHPRLVFPYGIKAAELAADIRYVLGR